jgi:tyrosyl-tRNA synthetase
VNLFDDLQWRGLIQDTTDVAEIERLLNGEPMTFYVGFDPTAQSLHVGHLVQVLTARRLQLAGHRPLLLVGGATGMIGDPRESAERALHSTDVVAGWVDNIRTQVAPFVTYDGPTAAMLVNNLDWTGSVNVLDFLRDVGKHFPINRMLAREVVRARLETGISFTEFSYQLLQANDYFELHNRYGCTLQFGGSDQWGNITAGVDFIRRKGAGPAHAFTTPLVTRADGSKIGKSEGGAVWLDPSLTSPYEFYQFWLNVADADVARYLRYFSFRGHAELAELDEATAERPGAREAQRTLAADLTTLVHGEHETAQVIAASQALFGRGSLADLTPSTLRAALTEAGLVTVKSDRPTVTALLKESGVVASMNEARRAIADGGAYINNVRVTDPEQIVGADDLLHGKWVVVRRGRKTVAGVEVVG